MCRSFSVLLEKHQAGHKAQLPRLPMTRVSFGLGKDVTFPCSAISTISR